MIRDLMVTAALIVQPCSVPEFGAVAQQYQHLVDMHVKANWEPRYHRYRCVAMAQILAESSGDRNAVSHTGAKGLAQFMPATWIEVSSRHGLACSPFDPNCAIQAYTLYSMHLIRYFKAPRPDSDRVGGWMTTAYHAGAGNADRAQVHCRGATLYSKMEPCLEKVIGKTNYHHNRRYVRRIASLFFRMTGWRLMDFGGETAVVKTFTDRDPETLPSISAECA